MKIVVTGGATIAPIDDVRLMTNVSTGRFAAAITESCLERGSTVWHIHSRSAQRPFWRSAQLALDAPVLSTELERLARLRERWLNVRDRLHLVPIGVGTVADYEATLKEVLRGQAIDVVILPMAVADFEPTPHVGKISSSTETLDVHCRRTPKVIRSIRDWCPAVYLVGFKLLSQVASQELIRQAEIACRTNRADLTVANDLHKLREGRHTLHLVRPGAEPETLEPGDDLAERLVARILTWAAARGEPIDQTGSKHAHE
jgi:phosphopantothenate-cysteine ligase